MNLMRYWFKFDITLSDSPPLGVLAGCGVTANNYEDAIQLIGEKVFKDRAVPEVKEYVENVDITSLDSNHVLPNIGNPHVRGIWFPLGYP